MHRKSRHNEAQSKITDLWRKTYICKQKHDKEEVELEQSSV